MGTASLRWTPQLLLGVREIDQQHRELFRQLDALIDAMDAGQGKARVAELVVFLERYVVQHFAAEERVMARHSYPHHAAHEAEHRRFMERLRGHAHRLMSEGPSAALAIELRFELASWLSKHIDGSDRALASFLGSTGSKA